MSTKTLSVKNCPVCKSGLRPIMVDEATIDFCPRCRGSWFDMNELQQVYELRDSASALLLPVFSDLARDPVLCKQCGSFNSRLDKLCANCKAPSQFLCPGCQRPLEVTHRDGLTVDCCRACKGVWLDGGELTTLFEQYSKTVQNRNAGGDVATAALALDMFIWAPDLYIAATAQVLTHLPELASKGLELAGDMPEIAAQAAEGLVQAAGSTSDVAVVAISGAIEVAGNVSGAASEAAASFMEVILVLISGIFD